MAKYDEQFKLEVVQQYLSGRSGAKTVANAHGLEKSMVRRWVAAYRAWGTDGLRRKGAHYDAVFKLEVIERMRREQWSLSQTAAFFDVRSTDHIGRWVRQYDAGGVDALVSRRGHHDRTMIAKRPKVVVPDKPDDELTDEQLIEKQRKELVYLRAENAYPKKARCLDPAKACGSAEKARLVTGLRQEHPLEALLTAAGLARSTFYYQSRAAQAGDTCAGLKARIQALYDKHRGCYGYRRVTLALRQAGETINHKAVQRLMGELALKAVVRVKKYRSYRGEAGRVAPNVLQRDFQATAPLQKLATDVTEFNVRGEKLYLSPVIDLYNGEIIAWQTAERPEFSLVSRMLDKALAKLGPKDKPVLHSDQGWQYHMPAWHQRLAAKGVTQSMSRKGNCLDNAVIESFFGTLKAECFRLKKFASIDELKRDIDRYIHYYNHERIKLKLKGLS
ncbi:IS3 family transposase, partial [Achromobacter sp. GG226]|uniref:IS3 family transposase n=1 Tax=Verticiella alkaliphila TaxID=2779529 RepID=UPI001C0DFE34